MARKKSKQKHRLDPLSKAMQEKFAQLMCPKEKAKYFCGNKLTKPVGLLRWDTLREESL